MLNIFWELKVEIICPECGFSRDMPPDRLPKHTVIANCPRCGCRFRFSADQGILGLLESEKTECNVFSPISNEQPIPEHQTDVEDDPLPPGAVIPGKMSDDAQKPSLPSVNGNEYDASNASKDSAKPRFIQTDDEHIRIISNEQQEANGPDADRNSHSSFYTTNFVENPWSVAPGKDGWLSGFYQTVLRVMLSAPRFFASLVPEIQHNRALLFYLIVCIIETVMDRVWVGVLRSVLEPGMSGDPQLSAMLELLTPDSNPFLSALKTTALLLLQAYLVSGLLFLMYRLVAGSNISFSIIFQVVAYSVAPHILCVVPVLGVFVGAVWGVGCLIVGLRTALKLNWGQTLVGLLPVIFLVAGSIQQILR